MKKKENTIEWKSRLLRLTAFTSTFNANNKKTDDWWKAISDEDPSINIQPKTGEKTYETDFKEGTLRLNILPIKTDIIYKVKEDFSFGEMPRIETLGDANKSIDLFEKVSRSWLKLNKNLPDIYRLAYGAVLISPVENHEEGYKRLSRLLPFEIDSKSYSNFTLQINKPTFSKIENKLKINRLTKWGNLKLNVEMGRSGSPEIVHTFPDVYTTQLELDINTDRDHRDTFSKTKLVKLFSELISNGQEISSRGLK